MHVYGKSAEVYVMEIAIGERPFVYVPPGGSTVIRGSTVVIAMLSAQVLYHKVMIKK